MIDDFRKKIFAKYGDKITIPHHSIYNNATVKIDAMCHIHGLFSRTPTQLLSEKVSKTKLNCGCLKCGVSEYDIFLEKAIRSHGTMYGYTNFIYSGSKVAGMITCNRCKIDFPQTPSRHVAGHGCYVCNHTESKISQTYTKEEYLNTLPVDNIHKFDYSKFVYTCSKTPSIIICKVDGHGEFPQTPNSHKNGNGCPKCKHEANLVRSLSNIEEFESDSVVIHGGKYSYGNSIYTGVRTHLLITCDVDGHGDFPQTPNNHKNGSGCPKCANNGLPSKGELELSHYIKSIYSGEVIGSDTKTIYPLHIDIYLPELNIGIEYNGVRWHSDVIETKSKYSHRDKHNLCKKNGIRLIYIWEDEWFSKREKIINHLRNIVGVPSKKFYARKLSLSTVCKTDQMLFMRSNHFQGYAFNHICVGLYDGAELVQLMSLKNLENDRNEWEIGRLCTKMGSVVIGGSERLFKYLIKEVHNKCDVIISYNEMDKFEGKIYEKLGMRHVSTKISYFYSKEGVRIDRRSMQKSMLIDKFKKRGLCYDGKTEEMMANELKYYRCYNSGTSKFELRLK